MPYYSTSQDDDFPEFSPEPYSAGYDINREYGEPLEYSDDTCHEMKMSRNDDVNYERPEFSDSLAQPSAYCSEALDAECSSYGSSPQLGSGQEYGSGYADPDSGAGKEGEDSQFETEYGSGSQPWSEYENPNPNVNGGHGRRHESEFESGIEEYGGSTEYRPANEYGNPDEYRYGDADAAEYENPRGRRKHDGKTDTTEYEIPDGYERKHEYGNTDTGEYGDTGEEYGSMYGRKQEYGDADLAEYDRPSEKYGDTEGYGRKHESYGTNEGTGYSYGRNNQEDDERPRRYHEYTDE